MLLAAIPANGQKLDPVKLSGKIVPESVKPGSKAKILITASIDPGWHLYSMTQPEGGPRPTKITIDENPLLEISAAVLQPAPKKLQDPNFGIVTETFETQAVFTVPVKISASPAIGSQVIPIKFSFQACDERQCLRPRTKTVEVKLTIIDAKAKAAVTTSGSPTPPPQQQLPVDKTASAPTSPPQQQLQSGGMAGGMTGGMASGNASSTTEGTTTGLTGGGTGAGTTSTQPTANTNAVNNDDDFANKYKNSDLWSFLLLAITTGFISLMTPCVFPMIPITVSYFTKQEEKSSGNSVKQAFIYCVGIILTFTVLGLLMTAIAGAAGINKLAANPWMNLFLTGLFVVFALNLFGMFEIRVPSSILTKLDAKSQTGTTAGTLLMGLAFTLTSFTCTAAFVGTVLGAAARGDRFRPLIGMLAFSTAFALPFFLLALFPKWLHSLPRSGGWMNRVKVVMGFIEIGAAFKFLSNVDLVWGWDTISRNLVLSAWIAISIIACIYLLGKILLPNDSPVQRLSVTAMLSSTFFLALAFYFLTGLFGANLGGWEAMLPPTPSTASASTGIAGGGSNTEGGWLTNYNEAKQIALKENKPLFLNFTGVTCTNCRWMEKNMFPDPIIKKELSKFVIVELFTDRLDKLHKEEDEKNGEFLDSFGTNALPYYVILDANGNKLASFASLTYDKNEFASFLQKGSTKFLTQK